MAKHNQQKTLGTLTDFQSSPQPTPENTDERIDRLERRVLQLESLLNDVMQVLDKPYQQNKHTQKGKPPATQKRDGKPPTKANLNGNKKGQAKAKTQTSPATEEQRQADAEAVIAFLHQHPDRFWKGTHLQKAIKEYCNLSNRRASSAVKRLRKNGHLVIIKDVEVDGEKLSGAYQFTPQPEPNE